MFLPIRTDSPLRTTPYVNWALIVANVLVYVVQSVRPEWVAGLLLYSHEPALPNFFSYAFLHEGAMHLAVNMLFLFIFGNNVNDRMGQVGYLCFYLAGAVFAGIGFVVTQQQAGAVLGASGAVAAVTGAYLVLFPRATITVFYFFIFIGSVEIPSLWFILFFFAQDLFLWAGAEARVAHSSHVSGTLFGFCVTLLLLTVNLLPRDTFDVLALLQRWNKRRQYRDMVAKGYNPWAHASGDAAGGGRGGPHAPPDPAVQRVLDVRADIAEALAQHRVERAAELYLHLRTLDPNQVLSRQAQLDVANQLYAAGQHGPAAEAYELFLANYPKYEQVEQVELILGLIYGRYLARYDRARDYLRRALERLHGERERALATEELARIEPLIPTGGGAAKA